MDWTAGYVADVGYTFGYYAELNPLRVKLAFLHAGIVPPEAGQACELGFGQGISTNIHAAASTTEWHGTDFNPAQAGFAQDLARTAAASARLYDDSFADFCARSDLPDFDYIGLHGIWSWISDENRAIIVDFVRRKLKVGGVLYVSYNTLPGLAPMLPVRHLLTQHAQLMAAPGDGIVARIDASLAFADKLFETNPHYTSANPGVLERVKALKAQNRHYLAHEYFNRDWQPMPFSQMAEALAPTKLSYACPANLDGHVDLINLSQEQRSLLGEISDRGFRETVRDFMTNKQFRKDYWVKGARALAPIERSEALRALRLVLLVPRAQAPLKSKGSRGEVTMSEAIYGPIYDLLAEHRPVSLGTLEQQLREAKVNLAQLVEAALLLVNLGAVALAQDEPAIEHSRPACARLNLRLMHQARSSEAVLVLASPVTGGGIPVNRFEQLFLLARTQGQTTADQWGRYAWEVLSAQGHRIMKDGAPLASPEENLAEMRQQAQSFAELRLPLLAALGIAA
ncbi:methyltransferase regulatory domain-containing protein [Oxalobacteraceae bacterium]|nr:methyltransferase regulatory domain-containing protein [Oxalobacteraceae bacterium]